MAEILKKLQAKSKVNKKMLMMMGLKRLKVRKMLN